MHVIFGPGFKAVFPTRLQAVMVQPGRTSQDALKSSRPVTPSPLSPAGAFKMSGKREPDPILSSNGSSAQTGPLQVMIYHVLPTRLITANEEEKEKENVSR